MRDALIHEAMHGVFYVSRAFQKFCYWFWEESMTEEERKTWVNFLMVEIQREYGYRISGE